MRVSRFLAAALFVAAAVLVVEAQPPQSPFAGPFGFDTTILVPNNPALQEELKVTDAQKEKFKGVIELRAAHAKRMAAAIKDAAGDEDKRKEAMTARLKDVEKLNTEIRKTVENVLTADQKKRLKQIALQMTGVRAIVNEAVAAELKLSDDQKAKVKGIMDEYSKGVQEGVGKNGFPKGDIDKEKVAENRKKRVQLTQAADAGIEGVLTADQKKQWKEMLGEPFDRTKLRQGSGTPPKGKE